jgi:hypothetical protein
MNTVELVSAINSNAVLKTNCVGVFSADRIPLPLLKGQSCIVNTDSSSEPGKHWILLFQKDQNELEFFCSYGMSPVLYNQTWKSFFYSHNTKVVYNSRQIQNVYSNTCGMHCLFCLYYRSLRVSFSTIITKFYTSNNCFNDRYVSDFLNKIVKYDLVKHLREPLQICTRMIDTVKND